MKPKPRISKSDDGWRVELPTVGFTTSRVVSGFTSWDGAGRWLSEQKPRSASAPPAVLERRQNYRQWNGRYDNYPVIIT